LEIQNKVFGDR